MERHHPRVALDSVSLGLVLLAGLCCPPIGAQAQPPPAVAETPGAAPAAGETVPDEPGEPSADAAAEANPCQAGGGEPSPWLDKMRLGVFESVCNTARWFDGFFGDQRFDDEARETSGRAQLRLLWDEFEGFDPKGRLRVRVELPNLDERVNAFVGRDDDDFISGRNEGFDLLPDFFQDADDQEWLLGLGYNPIGDARRRVDFDGGIKVRFPIEPFVRGRYRQFELLGADHVLRFSETVYWRNQKGFGTTTSVGLERAFGPRLLARWETRGTLDQSTEGVDWQTGVTLYQGLADQRALAWFAGIEGETDADVPLRSYGARVTYRQQMLRDWFFGEVLAGVTWPREELEERRELAWHVGFGFEIHFSGHDLQGGSRGR